MNGALGVTAHLLHLMTQYAFSIEESNTAFSSYMRGPIGYSDLPAYKWNKDFDLKRFQNELSTFNYYEGRALDTAIDELSDRLPLRGKMIFSAASMFKTKFRCYLGIIETEIRRTSFAPSLEDALTATEDIKLYLFLPPKFLVYASNLLRQALIDRQLISENEKDPKILYSVQNRGADKERDNEGEDEEGELDEDEDYNQDLTLVCWQINAITAWQQIDRRIDEYVSVSSRQIDAQM